MSATSHPGRPTRQSIARASSRRAPSHPPRRRSISTAAAPGVTVNNCDNCHSNEHRAQLWSANDTGERQRVQDVERQREQERQGEECGDVLPIGLR